MHGTRPGGHSNPVPIDERCWRTPPLPCGTTGREGIVAGSFNTTRRVRSLALAACAAALVTGAVAAPVAARVPAPRIKVLSNRADLVSGGDAFVRVTLPRGVKASRLRLKAGRRNVTRALHKTGRRRLEGVVRRLRVGRVSLVARVRRGGASRLFVTNHPIGGPVFAGPQEAVMQMIAMCHRGPAPARVDHVVVSDALPDMLKLRPSGETFAQLGTL